MESSLSLEAGNQEKRVTGKVSGHRQLTSGFINGRDRVHRGLRGPLLSQLYLITIGHTTCNGLRFWF